MLFFDDARREQVALLLREAAATQNLTQLDIADKLEVSQGTVSKILNGSVKKARLYIDLANTLGVELTDKDVTMSTASQPGQLASKQQKDKDALVMAVTIEKGGSGKTTTAVNLASIWADQGLDVLLVDLDPQGHSTLYLDLPKSGEKLVDSLKNRAPLEVLTTEFGVDVAIGGPALDELPILLANARNPLTCLKKVIKPLRSSYDIILIDTAPAMDLRAANAMVASDFVVIPAQAEEGALDGLGGLYAALEELREDYPHIKLLATIPTLVDKRCRAHTKNLNRLGKHPHLRATEHHIPRLIELAESFAAHTPVVHFKRDGKGARQYRLVARELLERAEELA